MTPYFDRPVLLALALLLPAAVVTLIVLWQRRRERRLARLGTAPMIERLVPAVALRAPWWRAALIGLASALAGIALAGPRWGSERTLVRSSGIDVVLALDASLSMLAADDRPSRLERMKQEVRRLRAAAPDDRFALLAFAGRSYILTPLTTDEGALDLFLDNLDPSVVGQAGSSLARTIRQATDLLLTGKGGGDRAIVVMSDGEAFEPEQEITEAAKRAADNGISLVTVGFGTITGATIPIRQGETVTQKRDEAGNVVVTRYHPELLQAAARAANGTFIDAAATDKAARVRAALGTLRRQARTSEAGRDQTPRFQWFLLPALLLLLTDTALAERRGRRRAAPAAAATAAVLLLVMVPRIARADDARDAAREYRAGRYARAAALYRRAIEHGDKDPRTLYDLGTALLAADSLGAAQEVLDRASAAPDSEVRYRALFNLGLVHLRQGLAAKADSADAPLDAALATYKKVLRMRSADGDAKWNYELALRKKRSGGGGGGGGGGGAQNPAPSSSQSSNQRAPLPRPSGGLGEREADAILNSAAREERDVQGKKQRQNQPEPPPGGKDW